MVPSCAMSVWRSKRPLQSKLAGAQTHSRYLFLLPFSLSPLPFSTFHIRIHFLLSTFFYLSCSSACHNSPHTLHSSLHYLNRLQEQQTARTTELGSNSNRQDHHTLLAFNWGPWKGEREVLYIHCRHSSHLLATSTCLVCQH